MSSAGADEVSRPSVLVPYPGPDGSGETQDIFVYMRPETNGVLAESAVLRVVERCPEYKSSLHLIYLANIPGDFMVRHHVVEEHYALKLYFAVHGKSALTDSMRKRFSDYFGRSFEHARILGAFEAVRELGLPPDELFDTWVPPADLLSISGQTVKRIGDCFVVNYDVPALLHKNNRGTDVATMVFRTSLEYDHFADLLEQMKEGLVEAHAMDPMYHLSRAVHHSKSPFEQVLDGLGYLYESDGAPVPLEELSFVAYCIRRGIPAEVIRGVLLHPLACFRKPDGTVVENEIVNYTYHDSFEESFEKLGSLVSQYILPREGRHFH